MKKLKPTEGELEILQILWNKEHATVRDVHEVILQTKDAGYTTTLKLMQIMFEKGLVSRDASAKTYIYQAVVSREKMQGQFVDRLISGLFGGSSSQLVMQALGNDATTKEQIEEIQQFLDNLKSK